jgi:CHAD domain-containing protein
MAYCFAVATIDAGQSNAAVLSIRLLALLERIPEHAGPEDVHRLRTTVRRLEVQLGDCPAKVSKSLKSLRKKAGKLRDIDVHLVLLKPALFLQMSGNRNAVSGLREKLRQKLREILKAKRDRHLAFLREVVAEAAPLLQAKLPILAERAARSKGSAAHDIHQQSARARKLFLRWTRSVPEDAERLHQLRIHTKKLRYSLEPMQEHEEAADLVAQLKRVQDAIGNWHDWATLEQLAERELADPEATPACAMLQARTGREYRKARRAAESVRTWMLGAKPPASAENYNRSQRLIRKVG